MKNLPGWLYINALHNPQSRQRTHFIRHKNGAADLAPGQLSFWPNDIGGSQALQPHRKGAGWQTHGPPAVPGLSRAATG